MCGLLGEFVWDSGTLSDRDAFGELLALSRKRGPDHTATWESGQVRLGFNRLSILDLSERGHQPMTDSTASCGLVYNGEIYNHREIRAELEQRGRTFKGHSDTETILNGILEWGFEECIPRLDGMFAIAFYDGSSHTLQLARDFAGIKPLFVGKGHEGLVFASQYDQVCRHPLIRPGRIKPELLRLYLEQHFMPAPFALIENTFQLEPGEMITVSADGQLTRTKYWDLPDEPEEEITDRRQALDYLDELLSDAVAHEMLSDVPLGAFLSGGIDSPLITAYAKQHSADIKTFSIGSDSRVHDESKEAQAYADQLGVKNLSYSMDGSSALDWWTKCMASLHEPLADYSILPTFVVSSLARSEVTVALSGDGGDELFYGYDRFSSVARNVSYQAWPYVLRAGIYLTDKYISGGKRFNSGLLNPSQAYGHRQLHSRMDPGFLNALGNRFTDFRTPDTYATYDYPLTGDEHALLKNMRRAEFYGMMQKTLRKVDLASMENSLEIRVPFLKKSVIEGSMKLDYHLSYSRNGPGKQILRDLLAEKIPGNAHNRPKKGFTVPLTAWSRTSLKEPIGDLLNDQVVTDLLGRENINRLWDRHLSGEQSNTWTIFTIYTLALWLKRIGK